jgi:hypothetical protein
MQHKNHWMKPAWCEELQWEEHKAMEEECKVCEEEM